MNYATIYNSIIERAQSRQLETYCENHHIIPKCIGGSDDVNNLVMLTPEEHYIAHQLLVKLHPTNKKLIFAAHMMTVGIADHRKNKSYGWLRRKMSANSSGSGNHMWGRSLTNEERLQRGRSGTDNAMFGRHHSAETKQKLSEKNKGAPGLVGEKNGMYGKKHTKTTKEKISKNNPWTGTAGAGTHPNTGHKCSEENKEYYRKLFTGTTLSEERRALLRVPKGPQEKVTCPHCNKTGGISNMKKYHFDNCKGKA